MSRLFYFLTVAVVACGTSSERPIVAPMTPAPAPIAPSEEPPGDVKFVLATGAAHQLLPTIRSRCLGHTMVWPDAQSASAWV